MAFDLMRGETTSRSWARGDFVTEKLAAEAKKKIPWKPVAIIGGILAGLFVLPNILGGRRRSRDGVPQHEFDPGLMSTVRVPRESNRETVYGRR